MMMNLKNKSRVKYAYKYTLDAETQTKLKKFVEAKDGDVGDYYYRHHEALTRDDMQRIIDATR